MKQRITIEQFNELGTDQKEVIWKWWTPEPGDVTFYKQNHQIEVMRPILKKIKNKLYPLLSIGQIIDFMQDIEFPNFTRQDGTWTVTIGEWVDRSNELCDSLWEILKKYL